MRSPSPSGGPAELSRVKCRLSKTTNRLQRHIEAIRNHEVAPGAYDHPGDSLESIPGLETRFDRERVSRLRTLDYPVQGKLLAPVQPVPASRVGYAEWEPAESLYIAIIVGAEDLDSGVLRDQLRSQRRQRHDAMIYRWQGEFTLDVIGFDAIDHKSDRLSGRVDLVLLSDRILGQDVGRVPVRELERIALQTRLQFRSSYIVGLLSEGDITTLMGHAFQTVEQKARLKGVTVFDQLLPLTLEQERISRLLVAYAKSRRYDAERSVWLTPHLGDVPLPIPKEDAPPGC